MSYLSPRPLPSNLEGLRELALDLRWSWNHQTNYIWSWLDKEVWERTENPYLVLQEVSEPRLAELSQDKMMVQEIKKALDDRRSALAEPGWFKKRYEQSSLRTVAYFSMEFGLSEALPIYAGGLGILAGDYLKTASDLDVPAVGIGLLYDQGYFQQILNQDGWQIEAYPYNDPTSLPVMPVQKHDGGWLRLSLELPGRTLYLRVWKVMVGKVALYLLDSNDALNSAWDRAITAQLYGGGKEHRLMQELVLGIGGWRTLQELGIDVDVCHLNEGHAAFATLARTQQLMEADGLSFYEALTLTRAGNLFTTHTPVAAGFDKFDPGLVRHYLNSYASEMGISVDEIINLGMDGEGLFNMAYLAIRSSCFVNGVSELHGKVSRSLFASLYWRWSLSEIPVGHVTNGVHMPSWSSSLAQELWTPLHKPLSRPDMVEDVSLAPVATEIPLTHANVSDKELFLFRENERQALVKYVRRRLERQVQEHGASEEVVSRARSILNPKALTLGFARRFAAYKRPDLLIRDFDRLARILGNTERPVQLIVAGKAHPSDDDGKRRIQAMVNASEHSSLSDHFVFLSDYDMSLTQQLVAGVDVWLNMPRRPMEASGTSGMKVLVNGGLNLSELDGWWPEAYTPEVGWALGDGEEHHDAEWDAHEADQLYTLLEEEIIPAFYERNAEGLPVSWLNRVRASMTQLTPRFNSQRMVREYVEKYYLSASEAYQHRKESGKPLANGLLNWRQRLDEAWPFLELSDFEAFQDGDLWHFSVQAVLGGLDPALIRVEVFAEATVGHASSVVELTPHEGVNALNNGRIYCGYAPADRPAHDYTPRIIPHHPDAFIPQEATHITWLE